MNGNMNHPLVTSRVTMTTPDLPTTENVSVLSMYLIVCRVPVVILLLDVFVDVNLVTAVKVNHYKDKRD